MQNTFDEVAFRKSLKPLRRETLMLMLIDAALVDCHAPRCAACLAAAATVTSDADLPSGDVGAIPAPQEPSDG